MARFSPLFTHSSPLPDFRGEPRYLNDSLLVTARGIPLLSAANAAKPFIYSEAW